MADDIVSASLDMVRRRKLADLAYREGATDVEMLRRLIDRAYQADLQAEVEMVKPGTLPPPVVG